MGLVPLYDRLIVETTGNVLLADFPDLPWAMLAEFAFVHGVRDEW